VAFRATEQTSDSHPRNATEGVPYKICGPLSNQPSRRDQKVKGERRHDTATSAWSVCIMLSAPSRTAAKCTATGRRRAAPCSQNEHLKLTILRARRQASSLRVQTRQTELTSWPNYGLLEESPLGADQGYERLRQRAVPAPKCSRAGASRRPSGSRPARPSRDSTAGGRRRSTLRAGPKAPIEVQYRWHNQGGGAAARGLVVLP